MELDKIGFWSQIKLEIIKKYAHAYSVILSRNSDTIKNYYYIDAFAGAGTHLDKISMEEIKGSPRIALETEPPFSHYYFIDMNVQKTENLAEIVANRSNVTIFNDDCNVILLNTLFDKVKWSDRNRALCLLDPYGLHLNWDVIKKAGELKTIEIFLNFPLMDMNMNILLSDPSRAKSSQIDRMNKFWGDDSWRDSAYSLEEDLFGEMRPRKLGHTFIANAFKKRLKEVAGFNYVADPIPMKNSNRGTLYYLFFASPNETGRKIVEDIFKKYRRKGW